MPEIVSNWLHKATILDWMTNITSVILMGLLALVIIGFRRYIKRPRSAPIDFIGTGLWGLAGTVLAQRMFWDLGPDFFTDYQSWAEIGLESTNINWLFNLCAITACLYLLHGYHILVEKRAPGRYNILTCVFYPKRLWLTVQVKEEPEVSDDPTDRTAEEKSNV